MATQLTDGGNPEANRNPAAMTIAVLVPCFNEKESIGHVVRDFRAALPSAGIYVYDNNSTDRTIEVAKEAGAIGRSEPQQGKGNVVRRMFADVDADVFVLVDGDNTYEAAAAPRLVELLVSDQLDMVTFAEMIVFLRLAWARQEGAA